MTIRIEGYFDRNFGDDYMIKAVADAMGDVSFYVKGADQISNVIYKCENIQVVNQISQNTGVLKVIGSGFMINSKVAFMVELVRFLQRKRDADYCINCNIEPFKSKLHEKLMAHKLNKYFFITCRDKKSYEWLKKHTKKPEIHFFPDILFSMDVTKKKGDKLGLALMHRQGDGYECEYYKKMAEIADWWIETTGQNVILMAFDTGKENDVYACDCVKKLMKHQECTELVLHGEGGEIIEAFGKCGKIIGTRFHSVVLALKMGIDVYPIIFRDKTKNLLEDINYPVKGSDISNINEDEIKEFLLKDKTGYSLPSDYEKKAKCHTEAFRKFLKNQQ